MSKTNLTGSVLYTKEAKQSKEKAIASLDATDPASPEEFDRIVKANALTGETKPNVHPTGNDRRTGNGSD